MSGSHMLGGGTTVSEILFGSAAATIVSASDIELVAVVPAQAAGSVPVTVTVDTGATVQSVLQWTYAEQGAVLSTDPASGQHGTTVVVSGTNLLGHGQSLTSITLAGVGAEVVGVPSNTEITVTAGLSGAAEGLVTITVNTGAVVSSTDRKSVV